MEAFMLTNNESPTKDDYIAPVSRSKSLDIRALTSLKDEFDEDLATPKKRMKSLDALAFSASGHGSPLPVADLLNSLDLDIDGNLKSGIKLSNSATESFLQRAKSEKNRLYGRNPNVFLNSSVGVIPMDTSPKQPTGTNALAKASSSIKEYSASKGRSRAKTKDSSNLMLKNLRLFDTRGNSIDNKTGIASATLIDYAFVVGPNILSLETAFTADSKSR